MFETQKILTVVSFVTLTLGRTEGGGGGREGLIWKMESEDKIIGFRNPHANITTVSDIFLFSLLV